MSTLYNDNEADRLKELSLGEEEIDRYREEERYEGEPHLLREEKALLPNILDEEPLLEDLLRDILSEPYEEEETQVGSEREKSLRPIEEQWARAQQESSQTSIRPDTAYTAPSPSIYNDEDEYLRERQERELYLSEQQEEEEEGFNYLDKKVARVAPNEANSIAEHSESQIGWEIHENSPITQHFDQYKQSTTNPIEGSRTLAGERVSAYSNFSPNQREITGERSKRNYTNEQFVQSFTEDVKDIGQLQGKLLADNTRVTSRIRQEMGWAVNVADVTISSSKLPEGFVSRPTNKEYIQDFRSNLSLAEVTGFKGTFFQFQEASVIEALVQQAEETPAKSIEILTQGYYSSKTLDKPPDLTNPQQRATYFKELKTGVSILVGNEVAAATVRAREDLANISIQTVDMAGSFHPKMGYYYNSEGTAIGGVFGTQNITPTLSKSNTIEEVVFLKQQQVGDIVGEKRVTSETAAKSQQVLTEIKAATDATHAFAGKSILDKEVVQTQFEAELGKKGEYVYLNEQVHEKVYQTLTEVKEGEKVVLNIQYLENIFKPTDDKKTTQEVEGTFDHYKLHMLDVIGELAKKGQLVMAVSERGMSEAQGLFEVLDTLRKLDVSNLEEKSLTKKAVETFKTLEENNAFRIIATQLMHSKTLAVFDETDQVKMLGITSANFTKNSYTKNVEAGLFISGDEILGLGIDSKDITNYYAKGIFDGTSHGLYVQRKGKAEAVEKAIDVLRAIGGQEGSSFKSANIGEHVPFIYSKRYLYDEAQKAYRVTGLDIQMRDKMTLSVTIGSTTITQYNAEKGRAELVEMPVVYTDKSNRLITGAFWQNRGSNILNISSLAGGRGRSVLPEETVKLDAVEVLSGMLYTLSVGSEYERYNRAAFLALDFLSQRKGISNALNDIRASQANSKLPHSKLPPIAEQTWEENAQILTGLLETPKLGEVSNYYESIMQVVGTSPEAMEFYRQQVLQGKKEIFTNMVDIFSQPHELPYSFGQKVYDKPYFGINDANMQILFPYYEPGSNKEISIAGPILGHQEITHADLINVGGREIMRQMSSSARPESKFPSEMPGGLYKAEGGTVNLLDLEIMNAMPGLRLLSAAEYKKEFDIYIPPDTSPEGETVEEKKARLAKHAALKEQYTSRVFSLAALEGNLDEQGYVKDTALLTYFMYNKTEQISARIKTIKSVRPFTISSPELTRFSTSFGLVSLQSLGLLKSGEKVNYQGEIDINKASGSQVYSNLPTTQFKVLEALINKYWQEIPQEDSRSEDLKRKEAVAKAIADVKERGLDIDEPLQGYVGAERPFLINFGGSPMSDFTYINSEVANRDRYLFTHRSQVIIDFQGIQSSPIDFQRELLDKLKVGTIFVATEQQLEAGSAAYQWVTTKLREDFDYRGRDTTELKDQILAKKKQLAQESSLTSSRIRVLLQEDRSKIKELVKAEVNRIDTDAAAKSRITSEIVNSSSQISEAEAKHILGQQNIVDSIVQTVTKSLKEKGLDTFAEEVAKAILREEQDINLQDENEELTQTIEKVIKETVKVAVRDVVLDAVTGGKYNRETIVAQESNITNIISKLKDTGTFRIMEGEVSRSQAAREIKTRVQESRSNFYINTPPLGEAEGYQYLKAFNIKGGGSETEPLEITLSKGVYNPIVDKQGRVVDYEKIGVIEEGFNTFFLDGIFTSSSKGRGTRYIEPVKIKAPAMARRLPEGISFLMKTPSFNTVDRQPGLMNANLEFLTNQTIISGMRGTNAKGPGINIAKPYFDELQDIRRTEGQGHIFQVSQEDIYGMIVPGQLKGFAFGIGYTLLKEGKSSQAYTYAQEGGRIAEALSLLMLGDKQVRKALLGYYDQTGNKTQFAALLKSDELSKTKSGIKAPGDLKTYEGVHTPTYEIYTGLMSLIHPDFIEKGAQGLIETVTRALQEPQGEYSQYLQEQTLRLFEITRTQLAINLGDEEHPRYTFDDQRGRSAALLAFLMKASEDLLSDIDLQRRMSRDKEGRPRGITELGYVDIGLLEVAGSEADYVNRGRAKIIQELTKLKSTESDKTRLNLGIEAAVNILGNAGSKSERAIIRELLDSPELKGVQYEYRPLLEHIDLALQDYGGIYSSLTRFYTDASYNQRYKAAAKAQGISLTGEVMSMEEYVRDWGEKEEEFQTQLEHTKLKLYHRYAIDQTTRLMEARIDPILNKIAVAVGMQDKTNLEGHYAQLLTDLQLDLYTQGSKEKKSLTTLQGVLLTIGGMIEEKYGYLNKEKARSSYSFKHINVLALGLAEGSEVLEQMSKNLGKTYDLSPIQTAEFSLDFGQAYSHITEKTPLRLFDQSFSGKTTFAISHASALYESFVDYMTTEDVSQKQQKLGTMRESFRLMYTNTIQTTAILARGKDETARKADLVVNEYMESILDNKSSLGLQIRYLIKDLASLAIKSSDQGEIEGVSKPDWEEAKRKWNEEWYHLSLEEKEIYAARMTRLERQTMLAFTLHNWYADIDSGSTHTRGYVKELASRPIDSLDIDPLKPQDSLTLKDKYREVGQYFFGAKGEETKQKQKEIKLLISSIIGNDLHSRIEAAMKRDPGKEYILGKQLERDYAQRELDRLQEVREKLRKGEGDRTKLQEEERYLAARERVHQAVLSNISKTYALDIPILELVGESDEVRSQRRVEEQDIFRVRVKSSQTYAPEQAWILGLDILERVTLVFPDFSSTALRSQYEMTEALYKVKSTGLLTKITEAVGKPDQPLYLTEGELSLYQELMTSSRKSREASLEIIKNEKIYRHSMGDQLPMKGASYIGMASFLVDSSQIALGSHLDNILQGANSQVQGVLDEMGRHFEESDLIEPEVTQRFLEVINQTGKVLHKEKWQEVTEASLREKLTATQEKRYKSNRYKAQDAGEDIENVPQPSIKEVFTETVMTLYQGRGTSHRLTSEQINRELVSSFIIFGRQGAPAGSGGAFAGGAERITEKDVNTKAALGGTSFRLDLKHNQSLMLMSLMGNQFTQLGDYDGDSFQAAVTKMAQATKEVVQSLEDLKKARAEKTLLEAKIKADLKEGGKVTVSEAIQNDIYNTYQQTLQQFRLVTGVYQDKQKALETLAKESQVQGREKIRKYAQQFLAIPEFLLEGEIPASVTRVEDSQDEYTHTAARRGAIGGRAGIIDDEDIGTLVKQTRDTMASYFDNRELLRGEMSEVLIRANITWNSQKKEINIEDATRLSPQERTNLDNLIARHKEFHTVEGQFNLDYTNTTELREGLLLTTSMLGQLDASINRIDSKSLSSILGSQLNMTTLREVQAVIGATGTGLLGKTYNTVIPLLGMASSELGVARALEAEGSTIHNILFQAIATKFPVGAERDSAVQHLLNILGKYNPANQEIATKPSLKIDFLEAERKMNASFGLLLDVQQFLRDAAVKPKEGGSLAQAASQFTLTGVDWLDIGANESVTGLSNLMKKARNNMDRGKVLDLFIGHKVGMTLSYDYDMLSEGDYQHYLEEQKKHQYIPTHELRAFSALQMLNEYVGGESLSPEDMMQQSAFKSFLTSRKLYLEQKAEEEKKSQITQLSKELNDSAGWGAGTKKEVMLATLYSGEFAGMNAQQKEDILDWYEKFQKLRKLEQSTILVHDKDVIEGVIADTLGKFRATFTYESVLEATGGTKRFEPYTAKLMQSLDITKDREGNHIINTAPSPSGVEDISIAARKEARRQELLRLAPDDPHIQEVVKKEIEIERRAQVNVYDNLFNIVGTRQGKIREVYEQTYQETLNKEALQYGEILSTRDVNELLGEYKLFTPNQEQAERLKPTLTNKDYEDHLDKAIVSTYQTSQLKATTQATREEAWKKKREIKGDKENNIAGTLDILNTEQEHLQKTNQIAVKEKELRQAVYKETRKLEEEIAKLKGTKQLEAHLKTLSEEEKNALQTDLDTIKAEKSKAKRANFEINRLKEKLKEETSEEQEARLSKLAESRESKEAALTSEIAARESLHTKLPETVSVLKQVNQAELALAESTKQIEQNSPEFDINKAKLENARSIYQEELSKQEKQEVQRLEEAKKEATNKVLEKAPRITRKTIEQAKVEKEAAITAIQSEFRSKVAKHDEIYNEIVKRHSAELNEISDRITQLKEEIEVGKKDNIARHILAEKNKELEKQYGRLKELKGLRADERRELRENQEKEIAELRKKTRTEIENQEEIFRQKSTLPPELSEEHKQVTTSYEQQIKAAHRRYSEAQAERNLNKLPSKEILDEAGRAMPEETREQREALTTQIGELSSELKGVSTTKETHRNEIKSLERKIVENEELLKPARIINSYLIINPLEREIAASHSRIETLKREIDQGEINKQEILGRALPLQQQLEALSGIVEVPLYRASREITEALVEKDALYRSQAEEKAKKAQAEEELAPLYAQEKALKSTYNLGYQDPPMGEKQRSPLIGEELYDLHKEVSEGSGWQQLTKEQKEAVVAREEQLKTYKQENRQLDTKIKEQEAIRSAQETSENYKRLTEQVAKVKLDIKAQEELENKEVNTELARLRAEERRLKLDLLKTPEQASIDKANEEIIKLREQKLQVLEKVIVEHKAISQATEGNFILNEQQLTLKEKEAELAKAHLDLEKANQVINTSSYERNRAALDKKLEEKRVVLGNQATQEQVIDALINDSQTSTAEKELLTQAKARVKMESAKVLYLQEREAVLNKLNNKDRGALINAAKNLIQEPRTSEQKQIEERVYQTAEAAALKKEQELEAKLTQEYQATRRPSQDYLDKVEKEIARFGLEQEGYRDAVLYALKKDKEAIAKGGKTEAKVMLRAVIEHHIQSQVDELRGTDEKIGLIQSLKNINEAIYKIAQGKAEVPGKGMTGTERIRAVNIARTALLNMLMRGKLDESSIAEVSGFMSTLAVDSQDPQERSRLLSAGALELPHIQKAISEAATAEVLANEKVIRSHSKRVVRDIYLQQHGKQEGIVPSPSIRGEGRGEERGEKELDRRMREARAELLKMETEHFESIRRAIGNENNEEPTELDKLRLKQFQESEEFKKAHGEVSSRLQETMNEVMTTQVPISEGSEEKISVVEGVTRTQSSLATQHDYQEQLAKLKAEHANLEIKNGAEDPDVKLIENLIKTHEAKLKEFESGDHNRIIRTATEGGGIINELIREVENTLQEKQLREERDLITKQLNQQSEQGRKLHGKGALFSIVGIPLLFGVLQGNVTFNDRVADMMSNALQALLTNVSYKDSSMSKALFNDHNLGKVEATKAEAAAEEMSKKIQMVRLRDFVRRNSNTTAGALEGAAFEMMFSGLHVVTSTVAEAVFKEEGAKRMWTEGLGAIAAMTISNVMTSRPIAGSNYTYDFAWDATVRILRQVASQILQEQSYILQQLVSGEDIAYDEETGESLSVIASEGDIQIDPSGAPMSPLAFALYLGEGDAFNTDSTDYTNIDNNA